MEDKGIKRRHYRSSDRTLRSAYRRRYGQSDSAAIEFNEKQDFRVDTVREVVDEVLIAVWKSA